jgi:hypothetical protein
MVISGGERGIPGGAKSKSQIVAIENRIVPLTLVTFLTNVQSF